MIKIKKNEKAIMPRKAYDTDAGIDLMTPISFCLPRNRSITIDTGISVEIPLNCVGMLKSKSGLNIKHGIISEGVIDYGYSGTIRVKLYNMGCRDYFFNRGDKITQLVIMPILEIKNYDIILVDEINQGERGDNGFGSSGL